MPALALLLFLPSVARAEGPRWMAAEPATGLGWILGGSALTVAGATDLATAPLCQLSAIRSSAQPACVATSIAFGAALLGAGIPLVVVGARKREVWRSWRASVGVGSVTVGGSW